MSDQSLLEQLATRLSDDRISVIDLTAPLSSKTPVIKLPGPHGQAWPFRKEVISQYDERGPHAYWNNFSMSEHTGTHFDAPVHWVSGKSHTDVSRVPAQRLVAPAAVIDLSHQNLDPDFLLERHHVLSWCEQYGDLPKNGWLLFRSGWDARDGSEESFLNNGHNPGVSPECAKWLAEETPIKGFGTETIGTDAGNASTLTPPFPIHWYMHGANKYGLTQLKNLARVPPTGAIVVVSPLPIVGGSGSPCRVYAIVEHVVRSNAAAEKAATND